MTQRSGDENNIGAMNIKDSEFETVAGRLESYASQVSELKMRLELRDVQYSLQQEINRLMLENQTLKCSLADMQGQLAQAQADRDAAERRAAETQHLAESQLVENALLRNCILLSLGSIQKFMVMVKRFDLKALFYTFLSKTLSREMGERGLQAVNEAVELTDREGLEKLADQLILENRGVIAHQ